MHVAAAVMQLLKCSSQVAHVAYRGLYPQDKDSCCGRDRTVWNNNREGLAAYDVRTCVVHRI